MTNPLDAYAQLEQEAAAAPWVAEPPIKDSNAYFVRARCESCHTRADHYPHDAAVATLNAYGGGWSRKPHREANARLIALSRNTVTEVIALAEAAAWARQTVDDNDLAEREPDDAIEVSIESILALSAALDALLAKIASEVK